MKAKQGDYIIIMSFRLFKNLVPIEKIAVALSNELSDSFDGVYIKKYRVELLNGDDYDKEIYYVKSNIIRKFWQRIK